MRAKLRNTWENIRSGLWFEPTVMVLGAIILASILSRIDRVLADQESRLGPWFFSGSPGAAQTLLAVIAGSLVTAISVAYSITIVALQLASSQFTPRVLRTSFTSDRGSKIVLGTYVGTFIYALLALRQIRDAGDGTGFVPSLSITVALGLALLCLAMLIYFIHHISQLLQVAYILDHVHDELIEEINTFFPPDTDIEAIDPVPSTVLVQRLEGAGEREYLRSTEAGFIRSIDEEALFEASDGAAAWILIRPRVGDYVPRGCVLAEFPSDAAIDAGCRERLRDAFVIDNERSIYQDPLFGVRQLVDIALKALSPAINDPTTAEYSLSHLGDVLGRLAQRDFPANEYRGPGGRTRYIISRPPWDEFVDLAFSQIRLQASDNVHVTGHLLRVLRELALATQPGNRRKAVQHQVDEVRRVVKVGHFGPSDTAALLSQCDSVDHALDQYPTREPIRNPIQVA